MHLSGPCVCRGPARWRWPAVVVGWSRGPLGGAPRVVLLYESTTQTHVDLMSSLWIRDRWSQSHSGENRRQKSGHARGPCRGARGDELMRTAARSHAQIAESHRKSHVILTQGCAMGARRVSAPAIGGVSRSSRAGKSCKRLSAASRSGGPRRGHARAMCNFYRVLARAFSITSRARRSRNLGFCRT